jgi:hypothetical protein
MGIAQWVAAFWMVMALWRANTAASIARQGLGAMVATKTSPPEQMGPLFDVARCSFALATFEILLALFCLGVAAVTWFTK